MTMYSMGILSG